MMDNRLESWVEAGLADRAMGRDEALGVLSDEGVALLPLVYAAGRVREHYFDRTVSVHMLDNVQNGACPEDCGYCGQSSVSEAAVQAYKLKGVDQIVAEAEAARAQGAFRFCMVMSGRGPDERDIRHMGEAIRRIKAMGMRTCLSAGLMDAEQTRRLAEAGLDRLNHNLNTSEGHYPNICTTHTYADRMATLRHARAAGLGVCSGMIVGMGEAYEDVVEVALALRAAGAESIPVNFLLPIEGNAVTGGGCGGGALTPELVLRVLCMFRFVNPTAELRVAAGREYHLRSMQALALWPANSLFMEGYLLSEGEAAAATLGMIFDAGFTVRLDGEWPESLREFVARRGVDRAGGRAGETALDGALGVTLKASVRKGMGKGNFVGVDEVRVSRGS